MYQVRTSDSKQSKNWTGGITEWYNEISFAPPEVLSKFAGGAYGHFTQVAWAKSWKIGCGYTMFALEDAAPFTTEQLYTCNYGPGGNVKNQPMYTQAAGASQCPKSTKKSTKYTSLCKAEEGQTPAEKNTTDTGLIFFCDFRYNDNCRLKVEPLKLATMREIYSGRYLSLTLKQNETATIDIPGKFKSSNGFCVEVTMRKGAARAADKSNNIFNATVTIPEQKWSSADHFAMDSLQWSKSSLDIR